MKITLNPFRWLGGLLARSLLNPLSQAMLVAGMVFSVLLGAGSLVGGTFLLAGAYRYAAVLCMALGCFFSGFLLEMFASKYIFRSGAMRKSDYDKLIEASGSGKLIAGLNDEVAELKAELDRLKSQRIDINSFRQIMELSLAEFDMKCDDVRTEWLKDECMLDRWLHDDKCPQYIGILHKEFKAKLGLDMKSVRLSRSKDGKTIYVHGLRPTINGIVPGREYWRLRQIQTFRILKKNEPAQDGHPDTEEELVKNGVLYKKDPAKKVDVDLDLNRIEEMSDRQRRELQERIVNGFEALRFAEEYIAKMGQSFVRCLLKASFPDCEIEFAGEPGADSIPLSDFVEDAYSAALAPCRASSGSPSVGAAGR